MRSCSGTGAVSVETGKICNGHGHICQRAIPHRDAFNFAGAKAFPTPAKQTTHIRVGPFHSETKCIHAVDVDDRGRRTGIDHQGASSIVDGDRNEQMIAKAPLQFRTGEALLREEASQRAAALL